MKRLKDFIVTMALLLLATVLAYWFYHTTESMTNMAIVYMMATVLISRYTSGYFWGIISCFIGVLGVNFFFTYPFWQIDFTRDGYPATFIGMLVISFITSATTTSMKEQTRLAEERDEMNKKLYESQKKLEVETEKEKMRANLLRAVSHDLRTPLTSMIGSSDLYLEAKDTLKEEEKEELIHHIREDATWLLHMVENLLSVTRIREGNTKVNKSPEPLEEVVSEGVIRLKKRYPGAEIRTTVPEDFLMVPMDATLVEQVIINLLENALLHSGSTRPIEFTVTKEKDTVLFQVRDHGIGIAEDKLPDLFDGISSERGRGSDSSKGMGIGLSICKSIITAHGGVIEARNHSDGAEFIFTLPLEGEAS